MGVTKILSTDITSCRECRHQYYDKVAMGYFCNKSDKEISVLDYSEGKEIPEFCELDDSY